MKLRNKKTGEIGYPYFQNWKEISCVIVDENAIQIAEYKSLAELNAEWEDYEEPKEYWTIDWTCTGVTSSKYSDDAIDDFNKSIGNYFETKEEAEKALEKLKAWKRLKDKGFRFDCYMKRSDWAGLSDVKALENLIDITAYLQKDKIKETEADLDLLFGGEE